ncbi:MAG: PAS domain-containing protein [Reyranellaceae bacterium]
MLARCLELRHFQRHAPCRRTSRGCCLFRESVLSGIDASILFNASPNPYVILDRDLSLVGMNEAYLRVTGRTRAALLGRNMFDAFPSDPGSPSGRLLRASFARVFETGQVDVLSLIPYPIAGADGSLQERYWSATHTPILDETGAVAFILQHTVDVTELHLLRSGRRADAMQLETGVLSRADAVQAANLRLDEERIWLRALFEQAPSFMAVLRGPDHVFDIANAAYLDLIGGREVIGRKVQDALPELVEQGFHDRLNRVFASGEPYVGQAVPVRLERRAGVLAQRFVDVVYQPVKAPDGSVIGIFVQGHDVTDQKLAEQAARDSEQRFRTLAESMPNHAWTALPDGNLDWFNERVYEYSGAAPGSLDGSNWAQIVHPDDVPEAAAVWAEALASGRSYQTEFRIRRRDGLFRWHIARAAPVRDADGNILRWIGTNTDIEDQKLAEAGMAELNATLEYRVAERTEELLRTQEALRQSQKMESIGNLAGGIAHDFNNLLQVIGGNLQLIAADVAGNPSVERRVRNALQGVSRGANLASQLLAFGRRQPLEPKVVNIGRLVRGMDEILRRSLGEEIELETIVAGGLWNTLIDPGNVENAILNLAINARDAMQGAGKLTIEAGNASLDAAYARHNVDAAPGQYVMLAVTDTGCGMTPDVVAQVFEPFFTTKPAGKGTGLGLSMVYGFVRQSGGHVKVYSEPGKGTTFRLYLPRSTQDEDLLVSAEPGPLRGGSETILVVEDDDAVRETAVALLEGLGYRVLKARDAAAALSIIESGAAVDLLFTDVVMPGPLGSTELARKAVLRMPALKVLFTSGYTENSIVHGGRLDPGVNLLGKPYSREALALRVRQILGGDGHPMPQAESGPADSNAPAEPLEASPLVLLCEDDVLIRMSTADMLQELGVRVLEAGTASQALELLATNRVAVLLTDIGLPDLSGIALAEQALQRWPALKVIFASGRDETPKSGPAAKSLLLAKPYDNVALAQVLRQALGALD